LPYKCRWLACGQQSQFWRAWSRNKNENGSEGQELTQRGPMCGKRQQREAHMQKQGRAKGCALEGQESVTTHVLTGSGGAARARRRRALQMANKKMLP
jgi:hypothetical protein